MPQEYDRVILTFVLRGRGSALVLLTTLTIFATRAEKPPKPLPVFHFLKIETPLGQELQRIRGILYGVLAMFCCLPEEARILERDPYSYAICRYSGFNCL
jgi:hypothetical protein